MSLHNKFTQTLLSEGLQRSLNRYRQNSIRLELQRRDAHDAMRRRAKKKPIQHKPLLETACYYQQFAFTGLYYKRQLAYTERLKDSYTFSSLTH